MPKVITRIMPPSQIGLKEKRIGSYSPNNMAKSDISKAINVYPSILTVSKMIPMDMKT
jgi:hypothetical protein